MASYGVWRFVIEYVRDDYRGSIGIESITPSQFIAILMILGSVGVFILERTYTNKVEKRYAEAEMLAGEQEPAKETTSQDDDEKI